MHRLLLVLLAAGVFGLGACDSGTYNDGDRGTGEGQIDPTPENKSGVPSQAFEPEDIGRAGEASDAVKEYCSGAVSEAQRVGCESHVDESDIP